jgi:hypothetical protein
MLDFKIHKSGTSVSLLLYSPNEVFLKALSKITPKLSDFTINPEMNMATFEALTIEMLVPNTQSYIQSLMMITSLTNQLVELTKLEHTFYRYQPENIIIINGNQYLYISTEDLVPLHDNLNTLTISKPFANSIFLAPELKNVNYLPYTTSRSCVYYSLGVLLLYCIFGLDDMANAEQVMKPIKETKLYWFIVRIIQTDCTKRFFMFI